MVSAYGMDLSVGNTHLTMENSIYNVCCAYIYCISNDVVACILIEVEVWLYIFYIIMLDESHIYVLFLFPILDSSRQTFWGNTASTLNSRETE